jgi:hypothetical protein
VKKIILINGKKRAGKDYIGNIINEMVVNSKVLRFADPMKEIIASTFDISLDELEMMKNESEEYGLEIKVYPNNQPDSVLKYIDFRTILQRFCTEGMKPLFGDNVWADLCIKQALKNEVSIITDFRFYQEYETAIEQDVKVYTINIFNDNLPEADEHASERDLKDKNFKFDYYIDNTNQPDIYEDTKMIVERILKD